MYDNISVPKELLANVDFSNTINGGMADFSARAWQENQGYQLTINAPSISPEKIRIEAVNQRFMVYYFLHVRDGEMPVPYMLVNLPLAPEIDVEHISARFEAGKIHIHAPFNDWSKGERREIDMEF